MSATQANLSTQADVAAPAVVELFAGLGGVSCAWPEAITKAALDISLPAKAIFQTNFAGHYRTCAIESLLPQDLNEWDAQVWWLSPPCQPFSRRGQRKDWEDPRTSALRNLISLLLDSSPDWLLLENVIGFEDSESFRRLSDTLTSCGYWLQWRSLCPSQLGWPNLRPRIYVIACRCAKWQGWLPLPNYETSWQQLVAECVEPSEIEELELPAEVTDKYRSAMDRVRRGDTKCTACFGSSYGKSLLQAGSYLEDAQGRLRRFSPLEVSRLLGFPKSFQLRPRAQESPNDSLREHSGGIEGRGPGNNRGLWKLLGNSLSLPAVRYIVAHVHAMDVRFSDIEPRLPWA